MLQQCPFIFSQKRREAENSHRWDRGGREQDDRSSSSRRLFACSARDLRGLPPSLIQVPATLLRSLGISVDTTNAQGEGNFERNTLIRRLVFAPEQATHEQQGGWRRHQTYRHSLQEARHEPHKSFYARPSQYIQFVPVPRPSLPSLTFSQPSSRAM